MVIDFIYLEEVVSKLREIDEKFRKLGDRRFKRGKGLSFGTNISKLDGGTRNFRFRSCILCFKVYDLDECVEFLKKFLIERRNFVKEKGLCFGCYSFEYIVKFCKSRKFC